MIRLGIGALLFILVGCQAKQQPVQLADRAAQSPVGSPSRDRIRTTAPENLTAVNSSPSSRPGLSSAKDPTTKPSIAPEVRPDDAAAKEKIGRASCRERV